MGDIAPNFSRIEFACKCGCGFDTVDIELIWVLESIRDYFDEPVEITSGCRCKKHNSKIGGSKNSKHTMGQAADIKVRNIPANEVRDFLVARYPNRFGIGSYSSWTHVDVRSTKARW